MTTLSSKQLPALLSGTSARVRYTCASVSRTHVAFGANSGSFYVYALSGMALARLGSFAELKAQALEKLLWVGDDLLVLASRRLLLVVDVCLRDSVAGKPRIVARVARPDDAASVTDVCVSSDGDEDPTLFVGDARGRVVAHVLRKRGLGGVLKSDVLVDLGAPIVQLDYSVADGLLVSTTVSCIIVKADASGVAQQRPIGTKARDGQYGAAFHRDGGVLFAARPGKRLWRAHAATGNVEATFNFAPSLAELAELALLPEAVRATQSFAARTQPIVFSRVIAVPLYGNNLLFAYESDALFLIDLTSGAVAQWSQDLHEILSVDVRVAVVAHDGEQRYAVELFVLHSCPSPGTCAVSCLTITPPPEERPPVASSVTFIDASGTEQPAAASAPKPAAEPVAALSESAEPEITSSSESGVVEPVADTDASAALGDADTVVKKVRRRKTAAQVSRRHVEIETGGAAFVPAPVQRAVVASGESARIDRATLDAVLGRSASAAPPPEPTGDAEPAPAAAAPIDAAPAVPAAPAPSAANDAPTKSFSKILTGNLQKMTSTTKDKLVHVTRTADDLIKTSSMNLARKLDERVGEATAGIAPLTTPRAAAAPDEPAAPVAPSVSPTVALQLALRVSVPPSMRQSEMPFDALSVDRRDDRSLPLALCGLRWRRAGPSALRQLREWWRTCSALQWSELGATRAVVAELLSACVWTAAYEPACDTASFVRSPIASECLDIDDALRSLCMRGQDECVPAVWLQSDEAPVAEGLELVRAGCRTRDLLRTLPALLAQGASDDAQREALEVCVANFPVVQARHVARWLGVSDDGAARDEHAAMLFLLYARILLETHTAMRYDTLFVHAMLRVLLRDGAPPRDDVLLADGRFKRGAAAAQWRHERTLLALLVQPKAAGERALFALDRAQALAWCREAGFYAGALCLLSTGEALQAAFDAGDEAALTRLAASCDDAGVWRQFLSANAHSPDAAALAIANARSSDAVDFAVNGDGDIDEHATRLLLAARDKEQRRTAIVRDVLAQLVQQVYRRTDANVAPQLRTVLAAEKAVVNALAGGAMSAADASAIKQQLQTLFVRTRDSYEVAFDYASPLPRSLEEATHHWGKALAKADVAGALCSICGLPLSADPRANPLVVGGSSGEGGAAVVVFPTCGHLQHQHCAQLWTAEAQTLLSPLACIDCCRDRSRTVH